MLSVDNGVRKKKLSTPTEVGAAYFYYGKLHDIIPSAISECFLVRTFGSSFSAENPGMLCLTDINNRSFGDGGGFVQDFPK